MDWITHYMFIYLSKFHSSSGLWWSSIGASSPSGAPSAFCGVNMCSVNIPFAPNINSESAAFVDAASVKYRKATLCTVMRDTQLFGDGRVLVEAKMAAIQIASLLCSVGNSSITELAVLLAVSGAM